jgi:hypothetical protein
MSSRDEDAKNPRLFDVRTVERNIRKGLITRKEYEKYLKSLADATGKAAPHEAQAAAAVPAPAAGAPAPTASAPAESSPPSPTGTPPAAG